MDKNRAFGPEEEEGGNMDKIKKSKSNTPFLDNFGKDLTKLASMSKLDPVIGREEEIDQTIQILNKRKKNNPILIGESGVGKTAIVEGLAIRIFNKQVDRWLFNKRIIELNITSVVSGTKYRGEFEQRMEEIIKEVQKNPDVILFIDEIHNVIGAGGASGSMDAANIIKPALARGEMRCIGATTLDEYKKVIENDSALDRRFQKVYVSIPTKEQTIEILKQISLKYEDYHNVVFSDEIIEKCVELSDRYITYRNFPDKAIDLMDEVGSRVKLSNVMISEEIKKLESDLRDAEIKKKEAAITQNYEAAAKYRDLVKDINIQIEEENVRWQEKVKEMKIQVTVEDVAKIIAKQTGIPLNKLTDSENQKLVQPKGVKKLITIYDVGGIAGQYNLFISQAEEHFYSLTTPIILQYSILDGKHISENLLRESLVKLSEKSGLIVIEANNNVIPGVLANLKINLKLDSEEWSDNIYAKVVEKSSESGAFYIKFTAKAPEVEKYFNQLYKTLNS